MLGQNRNRHKLTASCNALFASKSDAHGIFLMTHWRWSFTLIARYVGAYDPSPNFFNILYKAGAADRFTPPFTPPPTEKSISGSANFASQFGPAPPPALIGRCTSVAISSPAALSSSASSSSLSAEPIDGLRPPDCGAAPVGLCLLSGAPAPAAAGLMGSPSSDGRRGGIGGVPSSDGRFACPAAGAGGAAEPPTAPAAAAFGVPHISHLSCCN